MKERTSILLAPEILQRLRERARRRGSTLTREIESAVTRYLSEEDPNVGLKALVGIGERSQDWPAVDSDDADEAYGADLEDGTFDYGRGG